MAPTCSSNPMESQGVEAFTNVLIYIAIAATKALGLNIAWIVAMQLRRRFAVYGDGTKFLGM